MTNLNFEKLNGLIPAIIQDTRSNKILMLGFMNHESYEKTKSTGLVTFYSRTRQQIWTKGETSGNFLKVQSIIPDCDNDTILIKVIPQGPVCHTGSETCFGEENNSDLEFLNYLTNLIESRKKSNETDSYTSKLFIAGPKRIAKKVGEEAVELALEAESGEDDRFIDEAADLLYHTMVLLASRNLNLNDIAERLKQRHVGK
ncbi:MAG: bifunctional phosphoribosyl-AMP cyclohydrolase/phosphoribosyl-ATP diphosphatase HisIE [Tenuifilaceae bacterium]